MARCWRRAVAALAVVLLALAAVTTRLFVLPTRGMPARVDAIVMLNSPWAPLRTALRLARQHRAAFLVVSLGSAASHDRCPRPVPGVRLICFHPVPSTTQGEAEFAGRLARRYHWRSVAVVAITPQASRARLRMRRCFAGQVYVVTAPVPAADWPYEIAYQWGAAVKTLAIERGC